MSQLAKVELAAAPACPNCRNRVTDLDLDKLATNPEHQCLLCGHIMRVPKQILERLVAQREALKAALPPETWWSRLIQAVHRLFR